MLNFNITKLDIFQSYFFGEVDFNSDRYKMDIENERKDKVLKLPFEIKSKSEKNRVRMTGPRDLIVEDRVPHTKENQNGLK